MSTAPSPIGSEFATQELAHSYDRWFRTKVQASLYDSRPSIPHDQARAEMPRKVEERLAGGQAHRTATSPLSRPPRET
jgi:hypothetical protein